MSQMATNRVGRARHWAVLFVLLSAMPSAFALDLDRVKSLCTSAQPKWERPRLIIKDIGMLQAESRRLTVIDPGFMLPYVLSRLVKEAPSAKARVKLASLATGENIGMPAFLILLYGDLEKATSAELAEKTRLHPGEQQGYVGVDSGELCVIDETQIPKGDEAALLEFGDALIKQRGLQNLAVIDPKHAAYVVVKSGNGDGVYPCYWLKDAKGVSVALLIDFENWKDERK